MRASLVLPLVCSMSSAYAQDALTTVEQAVTLNDPASSWIAQRSAMPAMSMRGNNTSIIVQNGNRNRATTDQINGGNYARIEQTGTNNTASLQQYGSNGTINATQIGTGIGVTITQTGNAPAITITQTRPGR